MKASITVQMRDENANGESYGYTHEAAVLNWYSTGDMLVIVASETPNGSLLPIAAYPLVNVERFLIRQANERAVH